MTIGRARTWGLCSAGLLLVSAALQAVASLQRWAIGDSWDRIDSPIEDHRFDYFYPSSPWEPIGTAAPLSGVGQMLVGAAVLALVIALRSAREMAVWAAVAISILAAVPFFVLGAHAVLSGLAGVPSALLAWIEGPDYVVMCVVPLVGLGWLALAALRVSVVWSVAAVLLAGATPVGYLVSTFAIAPAVAGYQSYDTTPWTETIVAGWTAAAAVAVATGVVRKLTNRTRRPSPRDR